MEHQGVGILEGELHLHILERGGGGGDTGCNSSGDALASVPAKVIQ